MSILLVLILAVIIFWPWISKWLRGVMARRMEDAIRKMFGMPSLKEERRRNNSGRRSGQGGYGRQQTRQQESTGSKIVKEMQEYAEDVDFVEIKEETDPKKSNEKY